MVNRRDNSYSIGDDSPSAEGVTDWLLNSVAMTNMLSDSRDVADRILLEEVPSAREYLPPMVNALKERRAVEMDYQPYTHHAPPRHRAASLSAQDIPPAVVCHGA